MSSNQVIVRQYGNIAEDKTAGLLGFSMASTVVLGVGSVLVFLFIMASQIWVAAGIAVAAFLSGVYVEYLLPPLAVYVADTTVTLLRRMWRGERWYEGHRQHAYQHLAIRWGSHGKVTVAYTIFNLIVIGPSVWLANHLPELALPVLLATLILVAVLVLRAGGGAPSAATRQGDPSV